MKTVEMLKVGDVVWIHDVNRRGHSPDESVVVKIGTKLIHVGEGWRKIIFRKDTLRTNDDYQHQYLILSLEDEAERKLRSEYLREIERRVSGSKAEIENVRIAAAMLGINLEGVK